MMRIRSMAYQALADHADEFGAGVSVGDAQDGAVLLAPDDGRVSSLARAAFDPDDALSRMARSLRSSITASGQQASRAIRSVAVMGLLASTEASILAANLAISYAQLGTTTVLVEAGLGEPRQHALMKVPRDGGLAEVLGGQIDARSAAAPSAVRGLSVVTAGEGGDPAVLLDGERFHRRVMPLQDAFGMMVVDVGLSFADPPALCEALDAAVIVVRRDLTAVEDVRHLVGRLIEMNTIVVGIVIGS